MNESRLNNTENRNPMPRLCGFIICIVLSAVVYLTTLNAGVPGARTIHLACIVIVALWAILLLCSGGWTNYKKTEIAFFVTAFLFIAVFMGIVWHYGYLSNTPLIGINAENEGMHRDSLYHVAITSGIRYYGYPSLLVNTADFHNYHFGSHLIFAAISGLLNLHPYFTYCYMYPVLFFPLYASLILEVAKELRQYNKLSTKLTVADIMLLLWFSTYYILPQSWAHSVDNNISWIISESYCVSLVLALLFFKILFTLINNDIVYKYKAAKVTLLLVVIPIFIVMITLSKISVGLIFTCSILYYLLRTRGFGIKNILLELLYVTIVFAVHYVPEHIYSPIVSFSTGSVYSLQLLHFLRNYVGDHLLWGLYILFTFLLSGLFIAYRTRTYNTVKDLAEGVISKSLIVEETLLLICFFGELPELFIAIGGGSAFYFSSVQQIISTVLLIGYGTINEIVAKVKKPTSFTGKAISILVITCLLCNPVISFKRNARQLWQDCERVNVQLEESKKKGSYWETINDINRITGREKKDYYIYVGPNAKVWNKFSNPDSALFFYPAMTGVVCIGELYFEDGQLHTNNGKRKEDGYQYAPKEKVEKISEDEAYIKTIEDGKKALIVIDGKGMTVRETEKR